MGLKYLSLKSAPAAPAVYDRTVPRTTGVKLPVTGMQRQQHKNGQSC
jgi:hypothetical protein